MAGMVYVYFAPGFEEIEALTPVDMLRRAGVTVRMIGIGGRMVTGSHGVPIQCDLVAGEESLEDAEMLLLPGGVPGIDHLERDTHVRSMVREAANQGLWIASICGAPAILGRMGLLEGHRAVCYPGYEQSLQGSTIVDAEDGVCVDGRFITARGMGVATPFALRLVALLRGEEEAARVKEVICCLR